MTSAASNLLIQCVFYLVAAARAGQAARRVLRPRAVGRAHVPESGPWLDGTACLPRFGRGRKARDALDRVRHRHAGVQPGRPVRGLRAAARPAPAAAQSGGTGAVSADSSWNTAVSFATNTNWQGYGGESTMSYLTQMLALAVQNFVSAATGIAVLAALARAFSRRQAATIGNFWADLTRSTLYILLPLSLILALALVSQGVVQTFKPYDDTDRRENRLRRRRRRRQADDGQGGKPVMEKDHPGADRSPSGRPPRRSPSSSSAPTAAASSTSTRRIPTRTRRRWRISSRCCRSW